MTTQIICYNVNGVRARLDALDRLLSNYQPQVVGLQETKVEDDLFPVEWFQERGYNAHYFGQKGHYGVAFLTHQSLEIDENNIVRGFDARGFKQSKDAQRRFIGITVPTAAGDIRLYNGYFPQGESSSHPSKFGDKEHFYNNVIKHLLANHQPEDKVILMGDFNIAYEDIDIGIGDNNKKRWLREGKCCFLPQERAWYKRFNDWGLVDSYRHFNPETEHYSWFDYRSGGFDKEPKRGLRIDHLLVTKPLLSRCQSTSILSHFRGEDKPSDHCPIEVTIG